MEWGMTFTATYIQHGGLDNIDYRKSHRADHVVDLWLLQMNLYYNCHTCLLF